MTDKILNNKFLILFFLPFLLGSSTVFSFQPFNLFFINFIILPFFFLIIVYVKKKSKSVYRKKPYKKNLFTVGLFFGYGFYLSGIYWVANSLTFDENFKFLIPIYLIVIPFFLGLFTGFTTLIVGQFLNYNLISIFFFSASFSATDYKRGKILTGFPWNLWSYSLSNLNEFIQILNLTGLYAFNLLVITIFTLPVFLFFKKSKLKKFFVLITIFVTIFSSYIYGNFVINKNKGLLNSLSNKNRFYTKIVSPNFELKYNTSINEIETKIIKLIRYSNPNKEYKTLFVWPEGIFTGYSFEEIYKFKDLINQNFSNNHLILFGINTVDQVNGNYFNSLIIINNKFEIISKYNKTKLVPFGEFLPYETFFNKFGLKKITQGYGSFSKGRDQGNIIISDLNILPLICYEIIFPELVQNSDEKTNLIVNISEDGWFGDSIGPHQHFAKSIFRAVENNVFLVRSANKGISVILNNKGQIVRRLNTGETGSIEMNIPLIKSQFKNKNDLIFFILLFTYLVIFFSYRNKNNGK